MKLKKILKVTLITICTILVIGFATLTYLNRPISKEAAMEKIQKNLDKYVDKNEDVSGAIFSVHSGDGTLSETVYTDEYQSANQPFHMASAGKTFTAVLIGQLVDQGKLSYTDKVIRLLPEGTLDGLALYQGIDNKDQITVEHLLGHTSGIADFFEDPVTSGGDSMMTLMVENPDHMWKPEELVAFSRDKQVSVGKPGEKMHYSDTGYVLLGLIIETVTGQTYHEQLHSGILQPLGMDDSYQILKSKPQNTQQYPLLSAWLGGTDLIETNALSIDWAGGGVVSTVDDMLLFYKALNEGNLVSREVYERMINFDKAYLDGIYYSEGMMEFRFGDLHPMLSSMPNLYGGVGGATGTFVFYDAANDLYITCNYGSVIDMQNHVMNLISNLNTLSRIKN